MNGWEFVWKEEITAGKFDLPPPPSLASPVLIMLRFDKYTEYRRWSRGPIQQCISAFAIEFFTRVCIYDASGSDTECAYAPSGRGGGRGNWQQKPQ